MNTKDKKEYIKPVSEASDIVMEESLLNVSGDVRTFGVDNNAHTGVMGEGKQRMEDDVAYGDLW